MSNDNAENPILQTLDSGAVVRAADIRAYLESGLNTKGIKRLFPEIKSQTVALGRAFFLASDSDGYEQTRGKNPVGDYKILIDENLPYKLVGSLKRHFSHVTHTKHENLNGKPDQEVWRWAVNNNFDAIVTRDRASTHPQQDLTRIAQDEFKNVMRQVQEEGARIDVDELPLIIHVRGNSNPYKICTDLIDRYARDVHEEIETRSYAKISLAHDGVHRGKTYVELSPPKVKEPAVFDVVERRKRWVDEWMKTILNNKQDNQNIDDIRQLVEAGATICAMETQPESRFVGRNKIGVRPVGSVLP